MDPPSDIKLMRTDTTLWS